MIQSVLITQIESNPFQSRKELDLHAIRQLADSIRDTGFWNTPLRVRLHKNGDGRRTFQLVWGHQRLEALKLLGITKVDVEVVDLDDVRMAEESLIENLQRTTLQEMDRAEGIARLVEMEQNAGKKYPIAVERVRVLLGYESPGTITSYVRMAKLSEPTKTVLREENTGREIAKQAGYLGGEPMVRFAAKHHLGRHDIGKMQLPLNELPKELREKIVARIIEKEITEPSKVTEMVRHEQSKIANREDASPDLLMFIDQWTQQLKHWTPQLKAAGKHRDYIHKYPEIAGDFKTEAEHFIAALRYVADIGDGK